MNRRDLLHRVAGVAALVGAGRAALWHPQVWNTQGSGPATGLEVMLGFLTLMLANAGVLLLIYGARLRDGWIRDCERAAAKRKRRTTRGSTARAEEEQACKMAAAAMQLNSGRATLAAHLIQRAHRIVDRKITNKNRDGDIL